MTMIPILAQSLPHQRNIFATRAVGRTTVVFGQTSNLDAVFKNTHGVPKPSDAFMASLGQACREMPDVMALLRRLSYEVIGISQLHGRVIGDTGNSYIRIAESFEQPPKKAGDDVSPPKVLNVLETLERCNRSLKSVLAHEAGHAFSKRFAASLGLASDEIDAAPYFRQRLREEIRRDQSEAGFRHWLADEGFHFNDPVELFPEIFAECMGYPTLSSAYYGEEGFRYREYCPQSYRFVEGLLHSVGIATPGWPKSSGWEA